VRLEDFDYQLPHELIAQTPLEPRDSARLLVDQGDRDPSHKHVSDFLEFCGQGDVLVVNDTKVIPARLRLLRQSGGAAEVLLLERHGSAPETWEALIRPAKRLKLGEILFASDGTALIRIGERTAAGDTFLVSLLVTNNSVEESLVKYGEMPLPPYITTTLSQPDRYQTIYANRPASGK